MSKLETTQYNIDVEEGEPEPSQGEISPENEFPEGGFYANRVLAGAMAASFCSAGYVNSFGYVNVSPGSPGFSFSST